MTWHHLVMAALGVGAGIAGFFVPGAAVLTTPLCWALVGGALGNATLGPAVAKLITNAGGGTPPGGTPTVTGKPNT